MAYRHSKKFIPFLFFTITGLLAIGTVVIKRDHYVRGDHGQAFAKSQTGLNSPREENDVQPEAADAHGHNHAGEMLAHVPDLTQAFFASPELADDQHFFLPSSTRLIPDASCLGHQLFDGPGSAEDRMRRMYAFDPGERFPADAFYRNLTQFWIHNGEYYQLSADWDIAVPPVYRISLRVSSVADFSRDVREIDPPIAPPANADAVSSSAYIAQITNDAAKAGARIGLRVLEAEWPGEKDGSRIHVTLANSRPVAWSFPGGQCSGLLRSENLQCSCDRRLPDPAMVSVSTS